MVGVRRSCEVAILGFWQLCLREMGLVESMKRKFGGCAEDGGGNCGGSWREAMVGVMVGVLVGVTVGGRWGDGGGWWGL